MNNNNNAAITIGMKSKAINRQPLKDLHKSNQNCTGTLKKIHTYSSANSSSVSNINTNSETKTNTRTLEFLGKNCINTKRETKHKSNLNSKRVTTKNTLLESQNCTVACQSKRLSTLKEDQELDIIFHEDLKNIQIKENRKFISPKKRDVIKTENNLFLQKKSPSNVKYCETLFTLFVKPEDNYTTEPIKKIIRNELKITEYDSPKQIIHDGIPSLKKKTLKKQLYQSSGYKGVVNLDPNAHKVPPSIIYSDYMLDIVKNILLRENSIRINLKPFNNVQPIYRTAVVNWLVKLHQYTRSDAGVFYIAIRLFDRVLSLVNIPKEKYQLTAMVTYWIANKYADIVRSLTSQKLSEISGHIYSTKFLINYERDILEYLNFDISIEEPTTLLHYFVYILQVSDSNMLAFTANYLLDCLSLKWEINSFPLSMQASGALFLSLKLLKLDLNLWKKLENFPGYYPFEDLFCINMKILDQLKLVQNEQYEFREVFYKYANEKYSFLSQRITETLRNF